MKNNNYIKMAFLSIMVLLSSLQLCSQNQSMLLPIPGDVYPNPTGSKVINFINSSNTILTSLPKHSFQVGSYIGLLHAYKFANM